MATKNQEHPQDDTIDQDDIYNFKEIRGDQELTHSVHLRQIGAHNAGVYIARAVHNNCDVASPLFYGGRPFILKVYNLEAAEGTCDYYGVTLSDEVIASYLEMTEDGRLQNYVDFLSQPIDVEELPIEAKKLAKRYTYDQETFTNFDFTKFFTLSQPI